MGIAFCRSSVLTTTFIALRIFVNDRRGLYRLYSPLMYSLKNPKFDALSGD
jgi:hypothetical protein